MEDFMQRLLDEQKELDIKLVKLNNYLGTPHFYTLTSENQGLLEAQRDAMSKYSSILKERIELNK